MIKLYRENDGNETRFSFMKSKTFLFVIIKFLTICKASRILCSIQIYKMEGFETDHSRCTRKTFKENWVIKIKECSSSSVLKTWWMTYYYQCQKYDNIQRMVKRNIPHIFITIIINWGKNCCFFAPVLVFIIFFNKKKRLLDG